MVDTGPSTSTRGLPRPVARPWSQIVGLGLGAIGATWVATIVLELWPVHGATNSGRPVQAPDLVLLGIGLMLSCLGYWLSTDRENPRREAGAALAATATVGFVLAGLASVQLASWQLYAWRLSDEQGDVDWGPLVPGLVVPLLIGLVIGAFAGYGFVRLRAATRAPSQLAT